jgi:ribonuclease VapC
MMIDASAIVAILNAEPDASALAAAIEDAKAPYTSPIAIYEATVALMRENQWTGEEAGAVVREFMDAASIKVVLISESIAASAVRAFEQFGKGRHPAQLNMGDCFAYAAARAYRAALLFKGNDFTRTDLKNALDDERGG